MKKSVRTNDPIITENIPDLKKWKYLFLIFGFLLYANTISFDYALDDKIVIVSNQITTQGFSGVIDHFFYDSMDGFWAEQYGMDVADLNKEALVAGGRYRPLSLVTYAIEWELFGENPGLSHLINALLYGLTGWLLFSFLLKLFPQGNKPMWQSIAVWATLLFLSHPLHVEVVANIKSRDEILSLLFGLWSLQYLLNYADSKLLKDGVWASVLLFLSLLSKETTIAFVAIGPLMLYFFKVGDASAWKKSFLWLFLAGLSYTVLRFMVIGFSEGGIVAELMNNPFLNASESERLATIFLILAAYVKLLFLPFPLTHDYYPYHLPFLPEGDQYAAWSNLGTLSGVAIILVLLAVITIGFKRKSLLAFWALFFLGTTILVSNLLFPIGVFMNERFMYIPSIGAVVLVAHFSLNYLPQKFKAFKIEFAIGLLGIIIVAFSVMSMQRSMAWQNDETLALTDVSVSVGSAKVHMSAGDALLKELTREKDPEIRQEIINEAYYHLKTSLDIHPEYFPPLDLLGRLYFESGNYLESAKFYRHCAERKPGKHSFVENIFIVGNKLVAEIRYDEGVEVYDMALKFEPNNKRYLLAAAQVSAQNLRNPSMALPYMEQAYKLYPEDMDVAEKMGVTLAMLNRHAAAVEILEPLLLAHPNNANIMLNLGVAYYQSGQIERGTLLVNKSKALNN